MIYIGIILEFLLLLGIAYTPLGNRLFGCAPIGWEVWLFALPFALAMLLFDEARKAYLRHRQRSPLSYP